MWNESPSAAMQFVVIIGVYLLHSTLLLGGVWGLLKVARVRSFALQERLWKGAAIVPLVTAPLQQLEWLPHPELLSWTVGHPASSKSENPPAARSGATALARNSDALVPPQQSARVDRKVPGSAASASAPLDSDSATRLAAPLDDAAGTMNAVPPILSVLNGTDPDESPAPATGILPQAALERSSAPATGAPPVRTNLVVTEWAVRLAWIIVVLAGIALLRLTILAVSLQRRLRRAVPVTSGPVRECLDELLQRRRLRRPVRLLRCAELREPAASGLRNWLIVIPNDIEERLAREEMAALLAHEVAHLVRRDTVWLWIGRALCALAPWQPLNVLAARRWRTATEHLCDAWAVELGVAPLTLARCLARVAEWQLDARPAMGLTATGARSTLAGRIERLTSGTVQVDRAARRRGINAAIVAAALSLVCCGPRFGNEPATAEETTSAIGSPPSRSPARETSTPSRSDASSPEVAASDAVSDEELLRAELRSLLTDLLRLDELLSSVDDSPEFRVARDRFRRRIAELERRLGEVTAGATISFTSHPSVPAVSGPVQETMP